MKEKKNQTEVKQQTNKPPPLFPDLSRPPPPPPYHQHWSAPPPPSHQQRPAPPQFQGHDYSWQFQGRKRRPAFRPQYGNHHNNRRDNQRSGYQNNDRFNNYNGKFGQHKNYHYGANNKPRGNPQFLYGVQPHPIMNNQLRGQSFLYETPTFNRFSLLDNWGNLNWGQAL